MPATIASQWVGLAQAFPEGGASAVVVVGRGAPELAEAFHRAGAAPPALEADDLVLLADETPETEVSSLADLSAESAGLVVLRRAWDSRSEVDDVLRHAYRITRSGGRVLAGDLDVDRLLHSSSIRYPSKLQYLAVPEARQGLEARSTRMLLPLEVMRAGYRGVRTVELDEVRGRYEGVEAYWDAVKEVGWPVFAALDPEAAESLLEESATELRRIAPIGSVIDDEPWFVVTGIKG